MIDDKTLQENDLTNVKGGTDNAGNVGNNDHCHFSPSRYDRVRGCFETCGTCSYNSNRNSALSGYCDYPNKH